MPNRTSPLPPVATRKHQVHLRRDQVQTRLVLAIFGAVLGLVFLVIAFGWAYTYLLRPNDSLGTIYADPITVREYQKEFRYQLWMALDPYQRQIDSLKASGQTQTASSVFNQAQSIWSEYELSAEKQQGILAYVEVAHISQHEAAVRGISMSEADVDAEIQKAFQYTPAATQTAIALSTATSTAVPTATETPGGPTALPSLTSIPTAAVAPQTTAAVTVQTEATFLKNYDEFISRLQAKTGLTKADFRERIRTQALIQKVRSAIIAEMARVQPHAHLQVITVLNAVAADTVTTRLAAGEDWVVVAREMSVDAARREQAGEMGWVPIASLDRGSSEEIASRKAGEVTIPIIVSTTDGLQVNIYRVLEKDDREISSAFLPQAQETFYQLWLSQIMNDKTIMKMVALPADIIPIDPKVNP
jgi:hypothetical protein